MAKKITPNKIVRIAKKPRSSVRSYWLMKATGETEHGLWRGELQCGVPPLIEVAKLLDVPYGYIEHILVLFNGKRCSMFVDESGKLRDRCIINSKASAVYANMSFVKQGLASIVYDNPLEAPNVHPLLLMAHGLAIIGNALLWEGTLDNHAKPEGPIPSFLEIASIKT